MVKFWYEMRKRERLVTMERIKLCEKHGIGKTAMQEKERLKRLDRIIEESK